MNLEQAEETNNNNAIFAVHPLVQVGEQDASIVVSLEDGDVELRIDGLAKAQARRLIEALDGKTPIEAAADQAGIPHAAAWTLARHMSAEGLASRVRPIDSLSVFTPEQFSRMCRSLYQPLKDDFFAEPLWLHLSEGTAPQSVLIGWLIENYHFIEGVNDRLALAAGSSRHPKIRPLFVKHYLEEWNHYHFFVKALEAIGIPYYQLRRTRPLPATTAILNHMRDCARFDELAYAVCSGFLESTGEDRTKSLEFLARLEKNFCGQKPGAIMPLVDHLKLDEAYQHNSVVENVCFNLGENISAARAERAIASLLQLVETMKMWSREISRWYGGAQLKLAGCDWPRSMVVADEKRQSATIIRRKSATSEEVDSRLGTAAEHHSYLILRPDVEVTLYSDTVRVESLENIYTFKGIYAPFFRRLQNAFDLSEHRIEWMSAKLEPPPELLSYLLQEGLVMDVAPALRRSQVDEFINRYWALCEFWSTAFDRSEFWERVHSGKATVELILGWGIEFFKYVRAINEYLPLAIANCREDTEARSWLAKFFEEESDHSDMLLGGLARCGLDRQAVIDTPLLPSTRALLNWLRETAGGPTLGMAAAFGIMRGGANGFNPDELKKYYGSLTELYPKAQGLFDVILEHAMSDCDLGHEKLVMERMLLRQSAVQEPEAILTLDVARACAAQFTLFFDGIVDFYGKDTPELLRRDRTHRWMHWR
jgi:pyrroloquinoline quinone (PQQ) biosynthesis protein C